MKKRPALRSILCSLILCAALFLCSCSNLHKITYADEVYTDRTTGISYTILSSCYEPISRGAEYAKLNLSGVTHLLYEIGDLNPEEFLTTEYYDIYCADADSVPSFDEWKISALYICTNTAVVGASAILNASNGTDAQLIRDLRDAYLEGQRVTYPSAYQIENSYTLRYQAENVPGLYYCMSYIEYTEDVYDVVDGVEVNLGRYFIHDRYNKICVAVGDGIHARLNGDKT